MIEITNRTKSPVQLVVRSTRHPRSFTTLVVPGIGAGRNVIYIPDERHTEFVDRAEKAMKLITTRVVSQKK